jgi:uncharacterized protein YjiS (DUF1127 family)
MMDSVISRREPQAAAIRRASPALGRMAAWIRRHWKLSRDTARLMALDDYLLTDMGLTRGEIRGLVRRGQLPEGWTGR